MKKSFVVLFVLINISNIFGQNNTNNIIFRIYTIPQKIIQVKDTLMLGYSKPEDVLKSFYSANSESWIKSFLPLLVFHLSKKLGLPLLRVFHQQHLRKHIRERTINLTKRLIYILKKDVRLLSMTLFDVLKIHNFFAQSASASVVG